MKFSSAISILLVGIFSLCACETSSAAEISSRPILFVHGFNPFGIGENCQKDWSTMETTLAQQGYTGPMTTIGYYGDDYNCDVKTSPHGSILTPISDLSKDLAWYVYDQYSSHGVSVDIVTHSMGGLVLRYALYRTAVGDTDFPPYMMVTHAATLAAPFTGYSLLAEACHVNVLNVQCDEMFPLSSFIEGLKAPAALVPQGPDGTIWSGMGSNADFIDSSDGFVNSSSATSMNIPATSKIVLPWYKFVFHTMYTRNKAVIADMVNILATTAQGTPAPKVLAQRSIASETASEEYQGPVDAVISRQEITRDLSQLPQEQKPAQTEPQLDRSLTAEGIHFSKVLPGALFDKMGIQENDVVRGCSDDNINEPFDDLDQLETSSEPVLMQFCIVRNGLMITKHVLVR